MLDEKEQKKLYQLCTKISYAYTECYITNQGYILSMDKTKPFVILLEESQLELFTKLCGDFKILHITGIKDFKKDMDTGIEKVTSNAQTKRIIGLLDEYLNNINSCENWESFILSDDEEENQKLLASVFKDNNFVNFKPKDIDGPDIILTKSLLPNVSATNSSDLYYSTRQINDKLYLITFDFQFDVFRMYMLHFYIKMKDESEV